MSRSLSSKTCVVSYCDELPTDWCIEHPENAAFMNQVSRSGVKGIDIRFLRVEQEAQPTQFLMVCFTRIPIFGNHARSLAKKLLPHLTIGVGVIGNPTASVEAPESVPGRQALLAINRLLMKRCMFVCYKSLPVALQTKGCVTFQSLPAAILRVTPDYWTALSAKRRKDLMRHTKSASALRLEDRKGLPEHLIDRVFALYENTRKRSKNSFVQHTRDYFYKTSDVSRYLLYFENETLIGFHQLLQGQHMLCCKYVGMDYERSPQYRLYFAMMIEPINICIREQIPYLNFGITAYEFKQYLGAVLTPTWNVFSHATWAGRKVLPLMRFLLEPKTD